MGKVLGLPRFGFGGHAWGIGFRIAWAFEVWGYMEWRGFIITSVFFRKGGSLVAAQTKRHAIIRCLIGISSEQIIPTIKSHDSRCVEPRNLATDLQKQGIGSGVLSNQDYWNPQKMQKHPQKTRKQNMLNLARRCSTFRGCEGRSLYCFRSGLHAP